jgi:hypothetical protein
MQLRMYSKTSNRINVLSNYQKKIINVPNNKNILNKIMKKARLGKTGWRVNQFNQSGKKMCHKHIIRVINEL